MMAAVTDGTEHVIDAIDGALLDYSVSGDAMRWTPNAPPRPVIERPAPPTPEQVAEAFRRMGEAIRPLMEAFGEACRAAGENLARFRAAAVEAGLAPDQPPTDAQARALWLVQHRSTGPDRAPAGRQKRPRILR